MYNWQIFSPTLWVFSNRKILYVFTYINIKNMPDNLFFMDGSVVSTEFRTGQLLTDGETGGNGEGTRKGEGRQ
jgi:hypothetical protein